MPVTSTVPTSRRGYLSQGELEQYANITVTDSTEADDQISIAEELIDTYVGYQDKFYPYELTGKVSSAGSTSFTLQSTHQNIYGNDYFKWCYVEIVSGTGAGQRRKITTSTKEGVMTIESAWTVTPTSTSYYIIFQLGKFPRFKDVKYYSDSNEDIYLKQIPENIKRAVASQVEFIIEMGTRFFTSDQTEKQSESLGDYSYSNMQGTGGITRLIAPKAKMYLRGIKNITGKIVL